MCGALSALPRGAALGLPEELGEEEEEEEEEEEAQPCLLAPAQQSARP
jgi:hypothetical protein